MRLVHYKRIASAPDDEALRKLQVELIDRFGLLPEATKNLFRQTSLKLKAKDHGLRKIEVYEGTGIIEFEGDTRIDPIFLVKLVSENHKQYSLDKDQRLRFNWDDESDEARFVAVESTIDLLTNAIN